MCIEEASSVGGDSGCNLFRCFIIETLCPLIESWKSAHAGYYDVVASVTELFQGVRSFWEDWVISLVWIFQEADEEFLEACVQTFGEDVFKAEHFITEKVKSSVNIGW